LNVLYFMVMEAAGCIDTKKLIGVTVLALYVAISMFTLGNFTFWISLSLSLSLRPNSGLTPNLIQKVK